jgi:hypothetical protein
MSESPDWATPASDAPLCIDIKADLDRWGTYLLRAMGGGGTMRASPEERFLIEYGRQELTTRLWLFRDVEGKLHPVVVGYGDRDNEQIERWTNAVASALRALSGPEEMHQWRAVVGPSLRSNLSERKIALAEATTVGPLTLRPGGVLRHDVTHCRPPQYGCRSLRTSWPLFVEGTAKGYSHHVAMIRAAQELHRLSALLSLVWGLHWSVVHSPAPIRHAIIAIPPADPQGARIVGEAETRESNPQTLPAWLNTAWALLDARGELLDALDALCEGMALEEEHPSLALVAFVAAVEGVGGETLPPTPCKECGTVPRARDRFVAGLCRVMSSNKAEAMAKEIHKRRSRTAHSGTLHGEERYLGLPYFGAFGRPPEREFALTLVYRMETAAREVLTAALNTPLAR